MTHSVNATSCRDDHGFNGTSAADQRTDWLGNPVPAANRTSVAQEVDWLGRPTGAKGSASDACLRQTLLPSVSPPKVTRVGPARSSRPPAPPSLTFGQKSCLAYATGAALTGTVASGYAAKTVAAPFCVMVPPPYNLGCVGGVVGGGATIGGFVGGMTATQSPVCKGRFPWNR